MKNPFLEQLTAAGFALSALAAAGLLVLGLWRWSLGVMASTSWVFLNSFFLFQLMGMALNPSKEKKNDKILVLSILKFPVLYVAGFFILKSRFFPIYSVLLGLTLFMAAFSLVWLRWNLDSKRLERSA